MTTLSDGLRQSDRVRFRMPVEASWVSLDGATLTQNAETLLVSRNGGVLRLTERLSMGQELHLRRNLDGDNWKHTRARVVAEIDQDPPNHFLYAVHILEPRSDFWDIDFPAPHKADEALARLLMECSFCQRREVVYLNELQLKSFEVRKCVARVCKLCDSPSIWIESQSEIRDPENGAHGTTVEERVLHPRHRRHLRPHPHRLLPSHPPRRPLPSRRRLHQAPPRRLTQRPLRQNFFPAHTYKSPLKFFRGTTAVLP